MELWIVLVKDRHSSVDARPYSDRETAGADARDRAGDAAEEPALTERQVQDGTVLWLGYGTEGDCVSVIRREMDVRIAQWPLS